MEFTEIKLDKNTLPANGQKIQFETDYGEIKIGSYIEETSNVLDEEGDITSIWHVHQWKGIEV